MQSLCCTTYTQISEILTSNFCLWRALSELNILPSNCNNARIILVFINRSHCYIKQRRFKCLSCVTFSTRHKIAIGGIRFASSIKLYLKPCGETEIVSPMSINRTRIDMFVACDKKEQLFSEWNATTHNNQLTSESMRMARKNFWFSSNAKI